MPTITLYSHLCDDPTGLAGPRLADPTWVAPVADADLSAIFAAFNPHSHADQHRLRAIGHELPSLSVGDIVTLDSDTHNPTHHIVTPHGFREISDEEVLGVRAPPIPSRLPSGSPGSGSSPLRPEPHHSPQPQTTRSNTMTRTALPNAPGGAPTHDDVDLTTVPGHLFTPTGKWKYEVSLGYTGLDLDHYDLAALARQALANATRNGTSGVIISDLGDYWTLVVIAPPGRHGIPVMVRGSAMR